MTRSLLADPFAHHVWATLRLIDSCLALSPEQLATGVPGTYGSILETMRHTVGADASYLSVLSAGRFPVIDEDRMDLGELRSVMEASGPAWSWLLAQDLDPDVVVVRLRDDRSESHAPVGIRFAQALHHAHERGLIHRDNQRVRNTTGPRAITLRAFPFASSNCY